MNKFKYTESELKSLLKSIVILADTREQQNSHIIDWFDKNEIKYGKQKLNYGDYSFYLPKNESMGIMRDTYYTDSICVERKASIDEIIGNFATDRDRIEDEFLRHQGTMTLVIENGSYSDIRDGKYQGKYNPKAAIGTLHTFSERYNVPFIFLNKEDVGCYLYCKFYYYLRSLII